MILNASFSTLDFQAVLWCRHWWSDRSSSAHHHRASTLTADGSGCINGKVCCWMN